MKNINKKNKKKLIIQRFKINDLVLVSPGMHCYSVDWAKKHGLLANAGKYFSSEVLGKYLGISFDSGSLYNTIEINNELFEVFHINLKRVNNA